MTTRNIVHNKWLAERRKVFIRNALRDFLKASSFFKHIHGRCTEANEIAFKDLDYWIGTEVRKGPLWQLKDLCHALWGGEDLVDVEGAFLDWLIGSIFHEGMKLKENAYILEHYRPAYEKMMHQRRERAENNNNSIDYRELFTHTTEEAKAALARLSRFFRKASDQLYKILLKNTDNDLLIRFLVENEPQFDQIWGPDSIPRLFEKMFFGEKEKGYCLAAKSYQEGSWMENALYAYQKALQINPDSLEAQDGSRAVKNLLAKQSPAV